MPDMADVVVVTDSTACLPADVAAEHGIVVVPLQVVIGGESYDEGSPEATPAAVAAALKEKRTVSTSRPAPAFVTEVYEQVARSGAQAIVSVHLSAEMSATFESVQIAARNAEIPVVCVDTHQVGSATGFAALTASRVLAAGGDADAAAEAARERADASSSYFYVDTLEYLRRGGRVGAAAALVGGALAVKPILTIDEGAVAPLERVRTAGKALARLADLAVQAAEAVAEEQVEIAVTHLANLERAEALAADLAQRLEANVAGRPVRCEEIGGVLGAHVGPGMISVCVAPLGAETSQ